MAPEVTLDVTLTQSSTYGGKKSDSFRLTTPTHIDRPKAAAAAAPAGPEQQQEEAPLLQAAISSSSLQDAEFDQLCNSGSAWTRSNFVVKLYRHTLGLLKQIYLIFMTLSLRTNHLMVSSWSSSSSSSMTSMVCGGCVWQCQQPGLQLHAWYWVAWQGTCSKGSCKNVPATAACYNLGQCTRPKQTVWHETYTELQHSANTAPCSVEASHDSQCIQLNDLHHCLLPAACCLLARS
jgi:hypothetical protein